jgi:hypothetical protein
MSTAINANALDSVTWGDPLLAQLMGTQASATLDQSPADIAAAMRTSPELYTPMVWGAPVTGAPTVLAANTGAAAASSADPCAWYDVGCKANATIKTAKDSAQQTAVNTGIVALAVILIAIAVWKLT